MFLIVKDGFFHIKNLDLAKIETGMKIIICFLISILKALEKTLSIVIYVLTAIEKMDLAKLKEVRYKSFFLHHPNDYFADE